MRQESWPRTGYAKIGERDGSWCKSCKKLFSIAPVIPYNFTLKKRACGDTHSILNIVDFPLLPHSWLALQPGYCVHC